MTKLNKLHIARLGLMTPSVKGFVILDRGYASFDLVKTFMTVGISFLMRVHHKFNLDIDDLPLGDHEFY
ncbi:MAG: hypothetical protein LBS62_14495 [Clostridiales bacterium]|jgi:hypothetical protein|nr:hypothetical protein [Clostridiales bacterium]